MIAPRPRDLYTEVTGDYLSLNVDYTPAAETRDRTTTSGSGSIAGQFRFIADNSEGTNRDLFISSCKITAERRTSVHRRHHHGIGRDAPRHQREGSEHASIILDGRA